jgi:hypothetical protein
MVETKQLARLVKHSKLGKITKAVTIFQNALGLVKFRTDQGKDTQIPTLDIFHTTLNYYLDKGYTYVGDYELPTTIKSEAEIADEH